MLTNLSSMKKVIISDRIPWHALVGTSCEMHVEIMPMHPAAAITSPRFNRSKYQFFARHSAKNSIGKRFPEIAALPTLTVFEADDIWCAPLPDGQSLIVEITLKDSLA